MIMSVFAADGGMCYNRQPIITYATHRDGRRDRPDEARQPLEQHVKKEILLAIARKVPNPAAQ